MHAYMKYIYLLTVVLLPLSASAEPPSHSDMPSNYQEHGWRFHDEHGGHRHKQGGPCYSGERGEKYGACRPVFTREDAVKRIREFNPGDVSVVNVVERPGYFVADILDKDGRLLDKVIIHKRSGRTRSIF